MKEMIFDLRGLVLADEDETATKYPELFVELGDLPAIQSLQGMLIDYRDKIVRVRLTVVRKNKPQQQR